MTTPNEELTHIRDCFGSITTPEFLAIEYPDPIWTVPGMMTAGLCIVAGPPKVGKSWLVMQLAIAVANGGTFLGQDVPQGDSLYISLEGNNAFLQKRVQGLCGEGNKGPEELRWAFDAGRLHEGFEEQIQEYLTVHPDTKLVVVDTLVRVAPQRRSARTQYEEDAATLRGIEELAKEFTECAFLFVHHTRECKADDPLDALSGSRGLTGTIDTAWILSRWSGSGSTDGGMASFRTVGRHLTDEVDLALEFNKETCHWTVKGKAQEFIGGEARQDILGALRDSESGSMTPKELAEDLGKPAATVRKTLSRMLEARQLIKRGSEYSIDPEPF